MSSLDDARAVLAMLDRIEASAADTAHYDRLEAEARRLIDGAAAPDGAGPDDVAGAAEALRAVGKVFARMGELAKAAAKSHDQRLSALLGDPKDAQVAIAPSTRRRAQMVRKPSGNATVNRDGVERHADTLAELGVDHGQPVEPAPRCWPLVGTLRERERDLRDFGIDLAELLDEPAEDDVLTWATPQ